MKLSKFKFEKMSEAQLANIRGGRKAGFEGTTSTLDTSTTCTGTDHDAGSPDSD